MINEWESYTACFQTQIQEHCFVECYNMCLKYTITTVANRYILCNTISISKCKKYAVIFKITVDLMLIKRDGAACKYGEMQLRNAHYAYE